LNSPFDIIYELIAMIRICFLLTILTGSVSGFLASTKSPRNYLSSTETFLFDKLFEEEGMLGKGITVGKVQVCLRSSDRSATSIFGLLEDHADLDSDANEDLSRMANDVCLDLMRKSDDWVSACSSGKWFSEKDGGKAEGYYNELANEIATKFEKVGGRSNHKLRSVLTCLFDGRLRMLYDL
jgi:hypothetical protein